MNEHTQAPLNFYPKKIFLAPARVIGLKCLLEFQTNIFVNFFLVFFLICIPCMAHGDVVLPAAAQPLLENLKANVVVEPLPLSRPTEDALRKGRELLVKIAEVTGGVPLMDPVLVMKSFGFGEVNFVAPSNNPVYITAYPAGDSDQNKLQLGFASISLRPWTIPRKGSADYFAILSAQLNKSEFCISKNDVDDYFGLPEKTGLVMEAHPSDLTRDNNIGFAYYRMKKLPIEGVVAVMVFTFKYQKCASDFSFSYKFKD